VEQVGLQRDHEQIHLATKLGPSPVIERWACTLIYCFNIMREHVSMVICFPVMSWAVWLLPIASTHYVSNYIILQSCVNMNVAW
jgi:hypothetical protein